MEVMHERCCGLDIHKKVIVACLIKPGANGKPTKEIRSFGTMTDDLLALSDWLAANQVTHVAMESTGVYWKPVYNILETSFEVMLVNAQHIKMVPGRKTDAKDCEWIAELLQHGLLKGSFVPNRWQRELRELVRYRTSMVRERADEVNRLQKVLEGANIKLSSVASNVTGRSAREILEALIGGKKDAAAMAQLAKARLRNKIPELERALVGQFGPHQCFMVVQQLAHIDFLDETIERVSKEVTSRLCPFEATVERLDTIPGVDRRTAEVMVAEIGTDMGRFPTAGHLASWAGMSPGNNESAGKRHSGKTHKGSPWLRSALVQAAQAAGRKRDTYLFAQFHRLAARRGKKKASVAVGHSTLVIAYDMLKNNTIYQDLGSAYFDERGRQAVERRLIHRLQNLGYKVLLQPVPATA